MVRVAAAAGAAAGERRDHLWEVLHQREPAPPSQQGQLPPLRHGPQSRSAPTLPEANVGAFGDPSRFLKGRGLLLQQEPPRPDPNAAAWVAASLAGQQRAEAFEQEGRRFRDWVQRELEQVNGQLRSVHAAAREGQQQQHSQCEALAGRAQRLELQMHEMKAAVDEVGLKAQALARAAASGGAAAGDAAAGAAPAAAVQAAVENLRADLQREIDSRMALGAETTNQLRELHGLISQSNERRADFERHAATAEPAALRSELVAMREELRRSAGDTARKCEETAKLFNQRVANVQEMALAAAKELWEEHRGVVADCKTSLAALQEILGNKDKVAEQLQELQRQQREDATAELSQKAEALRQRLQLLETDLASEKCDRSEYCGRLGQALEQAQEGWLKDFEQLATEVRRADGVLAQNEKRIEAAGESLRERLEAFEQRTAEERAGTDAAAERIAQISAAAYEKLGDVEGRLQTSLGDALTLQRSREAQLDFELKRALRTGLDEQAERSREQSRLLEERNDTELERLWTALAEAGTISQRDLQELRTELIGRLAAASESLSQQCSAAVRAPGDIREAMAALERDLRAHVSDAKEQALDSAARTSKEASEAALKTRRQVEEMGAKQERACGDVARRLELAERRVAGLVDTVDSRLAARAAEDARLADELRRERDCSREEARRIVDAERTARLKAEVEQLATLQSRLDQQEEVLTRRLDDVAREREDFQATVKHELEARLLESLQAARETVNAELGRARQLHDAMCDMRDAVAFSQERLEERLADLEGGSRRSEAQWKEASTSLARMSAKQRHFEEKVAHLEEDLAAKLRIEFGQGASGFAASLASLEADLRRLGEEAAARQQEQERRGEACDKRLAAADKRLEETQAAAEATAEGLREHLAASQDRQDAEWRARLEQLSTDAEAARREAAAQVERLEAELQKRLDLAALDPVQETLEHLRQQLEIQKGEQGEAAEALRGELDRVVGRLGEVQKVQEASAEAQTSADALREHLERELEQLRGTVETARAEEAEARKELQQQVEAARAEEVEARQVLQQQVETARAEETEARRELQQQVETSKAEEAEGWQSKCEELRLEIERLKREQEEAQTKLREEAEATKAEGTELWKARCDELRSDLDRLEKEQEARANELQSKVEKADGEHSEEAGAWRARCEELSAELSRLRGDFDESWAELQRKAEKADGEKAEEADLSRARCEELAAEVARLRSELEDRLAEWQKKAEAASAEEARACEELRSDVERLRGEQATKAAELQREAGDERAATEARLKEVERSRAEALEVLAEARAADEGIRAQLDGLRDSEANLKKGHASLAATQAELEDGVKRLRARVDGGLDAMLVRLETALYAREAMDAAADGITNKFLGLLDKNSAKLDARIAQCEEAAKPPDKT